ncbi:HK97-gp10 family putative phage morphogenesis protein [Ruminiclostridium cellobioparum]|uniref:HK97-gp10 family putative phage morphogenesis protein n=1 Tax=Ruminiclostridium cellobioparum TaxID=29355 RepID=UPI000684DFDC|nr:HK97-gp10 family putative phage morphogenesis protein [Ruminiclostridium cellobioparum]
MAKMTITPPTDLMDKLTKLGFSGKEIGKKMLKKGAAILRDEVDSNLKKNLYRNRAYRKDFPTGALERSITISKPKENKNGDLSISVYFKGKDDKGVTNAQKAMAMEYGTSKQDAEPFIRPAVSSKEEKVIEAMQAVFNEEVKNT